MPSANSLFSQHSKPLWPKPLGRAAFYGLAGDVVQTISPHSESDPAALLLQLLVAFGNAVGHTPHYVVESTPHCMNLFLALVGETAKSRKGTSWDHIFRLIRGTDPDWCLRVKPGIASGEGLVWHLRDEHTPDKRLMLLEPEFASVLKVMKKDGNTASPTLRQAWDKGDLSTLSKGQPAHTTDAHISLIGHITIDELRTSLTATEKANGFGNRVIWALAARSKLLPDGGSLSDEEVLCLQASLREVLSAAKQVERIQRTPAARELWHEVYAELSEGKPGLVGAIVSRAEAIVTRLSCIYAMLGGHSLIEREHLEAALEVWRYAEESALYIFDISRNEYAQRVLTQLGQLQSGMTQSEIVKSIFNNHVNSEMLREVLSTLEKNGYIQGERVSSGGRTATHWKLAKKAKKVS